MTRRTASRLLAMLLVLTATVLAQTMTPITVKRTDNVKGVIVVTIQKAGKPFTLQCNDGSPSCTSLKGGTYQLVELPANQGMYECKDVQVFAETVTDPEQAEKLGEYCLIE